MSSPWVHQQIPPTKDFAGPGYSHSPYYDPPPIYTAVIPGSSPPSLTGSQILKTESLIPPPPYTAVHSPYKYTSSQLLINQWIKAHQPKSDFFFDLAPTTFAPLRLSEGGFSSFLNPYELREPATYPQLTRLRIVCDLIPQWPIDLEFRADALPEYGSDPSKPPPPISVGDVLIAVHRSMHTRITHRDWGKLSKGDELAIARAFDRRCKLSAVYEKERAQGVKRVDFLRGKTRMLGVERTTSEDGLEVMRLVLADGPLWNTATTINPKEESHSGQSGIPSNTLGMSEETVEPENRTSQTIDFICWPDDGKFVYRSTSASKSAETESQPLLHQQLPVVFKNGNGGSLIALVYDADCQTWVEEHFDDDLLVEIRKGGIGGPLPSVMGVNQPALVLFGSSADSDVLHFAEALANLSMYPVIVQPPDENLALTQHSKDIGHSSEPLHDDSGGERRGGGNGGRKQHGKGQGASNSGKRAWKGDDDLPDDDDMGECGDRDAEDGNGKDRDKIGVQDIDGFGNPHTTLVTVEFNIGKAHSQKLQRLTLERHVKFKQTEGPNRPLKSLERDCNVQVQLLVTPSGDGAEVKQCGSRSKLSFLAHATNPHVMNKVTYLRGPNDPAPQRLKNATANAKTAEGGFEAGPTGKVTGKWGKTTTRTREIQDSSDLPESGWLVRYFGAHSDKGEEIQTVSLDAKFERIDFAGGRRSLQERLDVTYGMGVNLIGELPKIGFVAQDSIDIWIPMKSKAKHAGVMLMVLDYIADISKDTSPLVLKEMCHEHTSDYQIDDVLVESSSSLQGREVGIALGVNSDPPAKPGKLDGLARKVVNFMGWQDTEEGSSLSASDVRDMFPAALGWDWKNQEVIPSVWASIEDLEANGWKIIREVPPPPPLPPKML